MTPTYNGAFIYMAGQGLPLKSLTANTQDQSDSEYLFEQGCTCDWKRTVVHLQTIKSEQIYIYIYTHMHRYIYIQTYIFAQNFIYI